MDGRSRTYQFLAAALVCSFFLSGVQTGSAAVLVAKGSAWRYVDDGFDRETSWKELSYDDDAWSFGRAELGYGDDVDGRPEATVIGYGPDPENRYITTYFRHYFYVDDVGSITNLIVRLLRDDGGIVYVNGWEAFRSGMPDGPVSFDTLASWPGTSGADETNYFPQSVDPELLFNGINVIAVEIHQVDPASDDLSFDLELVANEEPGGVTLARGPYLQMGTPTNLIVRWRTLGDAESRVQFGLTNGALNWVVFDPVATSEHIVALTNLAPDT